MGKLEDLKRLAEIIKNETEAGANNAERIGSAFEAVASTIEEVKNGKETVYISTGDNAYNVAVKNGFRGTEQEWLASLKGEKGDALYFNMLKPEEIAIIAEQLTDSQLNYLCRHLTDEQLVAIGNSVNVSDEQLGTLAAKLTPEQLAKMKGEKGDALKYSDLTDLQKKELAKPALDAVKNAKQEVDGRLKIVNHGTDDTTLAITPNVLHVWGEVPSLDLSFAEQAESGLLSEYCFQFTCPSEQATQLSLPSSVKWYNEYIVVPEVGKTYEASIVNNIIVMGGA